jgi:hypothetical protein
MHENLASDRGRISARLSGYLIVILLAASASAKSLDRINWLDHPAWNCAKVIAVRPFPVSGEFKGEKSQDEYMRYFVARLSSALVRPGGIESVVLAKEGESPVADAVLTGDFVELSAGSRAARFWVGFGAGTAKCDVHIRGYRSDGRTEIFDLEHARITPFSLSGDANMGDIEAVVADIGEELSRGRAPCDPSLIKAALPVAAPEEKPRVAEGAEVSIESSVADAEVFVDGKFAGNAPLPNYRLSAGMHVIEVKSAGYTPWKRELTVSEKATTRIVASLEKLPNP